VDGSPHAHVPERDVVAATGRRGGVDELPLGGGRSFSEDRLEEVPGSIYMFAAVTVGTSLAGAAKIAPF